MTATPETFAALTLVVLMLALTSAAVAAAMTLLESYWMLTAEGPVLPYVVSGTVRKKSHRQAPGSNRLPARRRPASNSPHPHRRESVDLVTSSHQNCHYLQTPTGLRV